MSSSQLSSQVAVKKILIDEEIGLKRGKFALANVFIGLKKN